MTCTVGHGVGTFCVVATWLGVRATIGGVVFVLGRCSDVLGRGFVAMRFVFITVATCLSLQL
jgi:hypothetical protein